MSNKKITVFLFLFIILLILVSFYTIYDKDAQRPTIGDNSVDVTQEFDRFRIDGRLKRNHYERTKIISAINTFREKGYDSTSWIQVYDSFGDYFNFSKHKVSTYRNIEGSMKLDSSGIPMIFYYDDYYYNPVTTAQYALTKYGQYISGEEKAKSEFLDAAHLLINLSNDGAYNYLFRYRYYVTDGYFEPPWLSGLAQGQVLSVYSRAFYITGDKLFIEEGEKALQVMIKPIEEGGTLGNLSYIDPQLSEYITFEEYPLIPNTYTLNGFVFSILGLYDWSKLNESGSLLAKEYYNKSEETLRLILEKYEYDAKGFPTYDLSYLNYPSEPNYNVSYHNIHIGLIDAMYQITEQSVYNEAVKRWKKVVK